MFDDLTDIDWRARYNELEEKSNELCEVFEEKKVESLYSQKPGDQKPKDFEGMSPQAIMATGYNSNK